MAQIGYVYRWMGLLFNEHNTSNLIGLGVQFLVSLVSILQKSIQLLRFRFEYFEITVRLAEYVE